MAEIRECCTVRCVCDRIQVTRRLVCASWMRAWPRRAVRVSARPWLFRRRSVRTASRRWTGRPVASPCQQQPRPPPPPPLKHTDNRCGNWTVCSWTYATICYLCFMTSRCANLLSGEGRTARQEHARRPQILSLCDHTARGQFIRSFDRMPIDISAGTYRIDHPDARQR